MYGLVDTILPIFTIQELGWSNTFFSEAFSIINILAGFLGMFIGGYMVDYFGKLKMLTLYLGLIAGIIAIFAFTTSFWHSNIYIYGFILLYYTLYTFLCIAVFASGMNLCWKTVAATQFTLYMALSNMGRASGSAIVGVLKANFSWDHVFYITALMPLIMGIIVQFINFRNHQDKVDSFTVLDHTLVTPHVIED
jgi:PAT family beta-lactamase induction signal transducer AmpG